MRASRLTSAIASAAVVVLAGSAVAIAAGDPTPSAPPRIAFVARGDGANFADALAVGSVAGQLGAPVFTTPMDSLSEATATALAEYAPAMVIITGGEAAVSENVRVSIMDATNLAPDNVVRAAGVNRYETAGEIAALLADISPAYLPVGATAVDADLLDGKDSTAYATASDVAGVLAGNAPVPFDATAEYNTGSVPAAQIGPLTVTLECVGAQGGATSLFHVVSNQGAITVHGQSHAAGAEVLIPTADTVMIWGASFGMVLLTVGVADGSFTETGCGMQGMIMTAS